jgi:hypothetical protein
MNERVYRYAVKAKNTSRILSVARFSKKKKKNIQISYTVNVTSNSGDPVTGAVITLSNTDENPDHIYTATANNTGIVNFVDIWKGTYNISVELEGYHLYWAQNIEINQDGLSHHALLEEIITEPCNLRIEKTANAGERRFLWSLSKYAVHKLNTGSSKSQLGYTVYLNGLEKASMISETEFVFTNLSNGNYTAGVKSLYTSGESEIVTIDFAVDENSIDMNHLSNLVLYPNPFTGEIHINHPELVKHIQITNTIGENIENVLFNGKSIITKNLSNGIYIVKIEFISGEKSFYKMISK